MASLQEIYYYFVECWPWLLVSHSLARFINVQGLHPHMLMEMQMHWRVEMREKPVVAWCSKRLIMLFPRDLLKPVVYILTKENEHQIIDSALGNVWNSIFFQSVIHGSALLMSLLSLCYFCQCILSFHSTIFASASYRHFYKFLVGNVEEMQHRLVMWSIVLTWPCKEWFCLCITRDNGSEWSLSERWLFWHFWKMSPVSKPDEATPQAASDTLWSCCQVKSADGLSILEQKIHRLHRSENFEHI